MTYMLKLDAVLWEEITLRINDETTGQYAEMNEIDRHKDI